MSEIKPALERFKAYCASKGIPEKSSLVHIHKMSEFEEHERKELRTAYEALQKQNKALKLMCDSKTSQLEIADKEVARLSALDEDNKGLKACNSILTIENASQAKRIVSLVNFYDQKLLDAEKVLQESNSTWHRLLSLEEKRVKELEQAASINQE